MGAWRVEGCDCPLVVRACAETIVVLGYFVVDIISFVCVFCLFEMDFLHDGSYRARFYSSKRASLYRRVCWSHSNTCYVYACRYQWQHDDGVLTLFSAPNYCYRSGAILIYLCVHYLCVCVCVCVCVELFAYSEIFCLPSVANGRIYNSTPFTATTTPHKHRCGNMAAILQIDEQLNHEVGTDWRCSKRRNERRLRWMNIIFRIIDHYEFREFVSTHTHTHTQHTCSPQPCLQVLQYDPAPMHPTERKPKVQMRMSCLNFVNVFYSFTPPPPPLSHTRARTRTHPLVYPPRWLNHLMNDE